MARTDKLKHFLVDIADKIRSKLGTTEPIPHEEYDSKIEEVYEAGKIAEYKNFWRKALVHKENTAFEYTFSDTFWNDDTLQIPEEYLPLKPSSTNYMFRSCGATVLPTIDFTGCETLRYTYSYARNAVTIGTIILRDDGTNVFSNTFSSCDALVNITFEGVIGDSVSFASSRYLSNESINNIIEHLADLTGKDSETLTFYSGIASKLTTEQTNAIAAKNWNVG